MTWSAHLDHSRQMPYAAPTQRRSIAETLTDATEVMLVSETKPWPVADIRIALRTWSFSNRLRGMELPAETRPIITWLETATVPVSDLTVPTTGPALTRVLLDRISTKQDGSVAAANTSNRKRGVLSGVMRFAVEIGAVDVNPLDTVKR